MDGACEGGVPLHLHPDRLTRHCNKSLRARSRADRCRFSASACGRRGGCAAALFSLREQRLPRRLGMALPLHISFTTDQVTPVLAPQKTRSPSNRARERAAAWFRANALSIVTLALFLVTVLGQVAFGFTAHNQDLSERGRPHLSLAAYLSSGHFIEALFENWESEFLQMGVFVWLSARLRQRGSAESKPLDEAFEGDEDPRQHRNDASAPWPVRHGGWVVWLYERSLVVAFVSLFALSLMFHAIGGCIEENERRAEHHLPAQSVLQFAASSEFWFQSFQNWQSEFLAVFSIVTLTIFLRQRGSPQSKPVAAPHTATGK